MTGVWYHGGEDSTAVQTMKLQSVISQSELDSSDVSCLLLLLVCVYIYVMHVIKVIIICLL